MRYLRFMALGSVILGVVMAGIAGCGGGHRTGGQSVAREACEDARD